jgi:hypothetical protein
LNKKLNFFTQNVRKSYLFVVFLCIFIHENQLGGRIMNKFLMLPLFAMAALVSQAVAQETWTPCGGDKAGYCKWGSACSPINTCTGGAAGSDCANQKPTCDGVYQNCLDNSDTHTVYSDASCNTPKEVGATQNCGEWCDWGTGGCWEIKTDLTGKDGPATTTCQEAKDNCDAGGIRWSGASCTGNKLGGNESCGKYCKWDTCTEIKPDPTGEFGTATANCNEAIANCAENGELFNNSTCTGTPVQPSSSSGGGGNPGSSSSGGTPIIVSYNGAPVTGLNVVHFANSLRIASSKDATVSLFDMRGKQVFGQKVFSGTTTINLENQKQGVYYAVITSGSQKQTVKVVLK